MNAIALKVAKSGVILLAESILRLGTVAVVSFWIARQLGPAQFGVLNAASALLAILIALSEMGMSTPVILRLVRGSDAGEVIGSIITLRAFSSSLAYAIALVLALQLAKEKPIALFPTLIVCLSLFCNVPNAIDYYFKARTDAAPPAFARTIATLLAAFAKAVCLVLSLGIVALSWTVVLEAAFTSAGLMIAYKRSDSGGRRSPMSVRLQSVYPLLKQAPPYLFTSVAVLLYMKLDVVLLGFLSSSTETGVYGLAQKLSEVIYIVPVVLLSSVYPSLATKLRRGLPTSETSKQMLFDLAIGGAIIVVAISNLIVKYAVEIVFGSAYESAVTIFHIHSWSCIAIAMAEARLQWMASMSLQRYAPMATAIGLIANITLNVYLIPRLGALGAAIATVVSYFISGYITSFLFRPLREIAIAQTRALWPWERLYAATKLLGVTSTV